MHQEVSELKSEVEPEKVSDGEGFSWMNEELQK